MPASIAATSSRDSVSLISIPDTSPANTDTGWICRMDTVIGMGSSAEDGTLGAPSSGRGDCMRTFEGVKILDCTHVLAGQFAAYQLAVLGADVIKVDDPNEPDQSRESGADHTLNKAGMGTGFLTQGSNQSAIALHLQTEA